MYKGWNTEIVFIDIRFPPSLILLNCAMDTKLSGSTGAHMETVHFPKTVVMEADNLLDLVIAQNKDIEVGSAGSIKEVNILPIEEKLDDLDLKAENESQ